MNKVYQFLDLGEVNAPYMDEMVDAASRVIRSGRYVGGCEVDAFEFELAEMLKVGNVVGCSNGLDALRLILHGYINMGIMAPGDEVIVPANTYIATFLAITDAGLMPVPVDVDIHTMNIDTDLIEAAVTKRTRAIIPVHLYGRVVWDYTMNDVAERYGLKVIEDCAQAIGGRSVLHGRNGSHYAGALGDAGAFSFYPTKNIGALGDAGAVATDDDELANAVRALANYGSDRRYHNIYSGYNCRLDAIQAAMLRVKLRYLERENSDRFERALAYNRTINRADVVIPVMSRTVVDNVWHQYVIRVKGYKRDLFRMALAKAGVMTDIHYEVPPYRQPCYRHLAHGTLPVTERLAREILSLPIATGTTVKDAAEIAEIINGLKI